MNKEKWEQLIGLHATFTKEGELIVHRNSKVIKLIRPSGDLTHYMVCGIEHRSVLITPDMFLVTKIPKKFVIIN